MKQTMFFCLLTLTILAISCATDTKRIRTPTTLVSIKDPDLRQKKYNHFLVAPVGKNAEQGQQMGALVVQEFKKEGLKATLNEDLFPSTQEYKPEQVKKRLAQRGIDTILMIRLIDQKIKRVVNPDMDAFPGTFEQRDLYPAYYTLARTYEVAAESQMITTQDYELILQDARTLQPVWVGSSTSQTVANGDREDLIRLFVQKTINQLRADGFIGRRP